MWKVGSKSFFVLPCSILMLFTTDLAVVTAWQSPLSPISTTTTFHPSRSVQAATPPTRSLTRLAVFTKEKSSTATTSNTPNNKNKSNNNNKKDKPAVENDVVETTEKYGLEAGLFQSFRQGGENGGETAKSLLQKYGIAYLATSIPLALISFLLCYALVDAGVDVAALLKQIGIDETTASSTETAGTLAIAYAAHKAASPIRFPPTVLLTPVVARLIGKEPNTNDNNNNNKNDNKKA